MHQLKGVRGAHLDPGELSATDPQIIERFRVAVQSQNFYCLFSTETDVFYLEMMPFVLPALSKVADGDARSARGTTDGAPEESGESPLGR